MIFLLQDARNEVSDLKAFRSMYHELLQKYQNFEDTKSADRASIQEKATQ